MTDLIESIKDFCVEQAKQWYKDNNEQAPWLDDEDDNWREDDVFYDAYNDFFYGWNGVRTLSIGQVSVAEADRVNDEQWVVFQVDDKLFKVTTYYTSYDSPDWDEADIFEVKAESKTITVYNRV